MAILQIVKENGDIERFSLAGGEITIGRVESNDLVLNDFSVSRQHARLYQKDNIWTLEDLGSHNGTLVNKKIIRSAELVNGDHIKVGNNHLIFQAEEITKQEERTLELPEPEKSEPILPEPEELATPSPEPEEERPSPSEQDKPEPVGPTPVEPEPEPLSRVPSPPQPVKQAPPVPPLPSAHETVQMTLSKSKDPLEFIRRVPIFSAFPDQELTELMDAAEPLSFKAGSVLYEQNDPGDRLYIVFSGRIRLVQKKEDGKEVNLGVLRKGDHFGEASLIHAKPRNAEARAVEDSVVVAIAGDIFHNFLLGKPELREYFDKSIKYSSIVQFIKNFSSLSAVPAKHLLSMARKFKAEFYNKGDAVLRQGGHVKKFFPD